MKDREWILEKRNLSRILTAIVGFPINVLEATNGELGYTYGDNSVYVARYHETIKDLSSKEQMIFREGVCIHEIMHKILTDFATALQVIKPYPIFEQRLLSQFINIAEDPAIENFAPQHIGGRPLRSLKYTIAYVYRKSSNIDLYDNALIQYMNALIQFGDMGLIKGRFTFPEAKDMFHKTSEIMLKCIEEPDAQKRVYYGRDIFELSRPLWEEYIKEQKLLNELFEQLAKLGKNNKIPNNSRPQSSSKQNPNLGIKNKRRRITIKKVSKEELDEMKKNGELKEDPPSEDEDITLLICDEENNPKEKKEQEKEKSSDDQQNSANSSGSSNKEKSKDSSDKSQNNSGSSGTSDKESGNDTFDDSQNANSSSGTSDKESGNDSFDDSQNANSSSGRSSNENIPKTVYPENSSSVEYNEEEYEITDDEYKISDDDIKAIEKELEIALNNEEKEDYKDIENENLTLDFPVTTNKIPGVKCINKRVICDVESLEETYDYRVNLIKSGILRLTKQLAVIFRNDNEEIIRNTTGNINIHRLNSSTKTTKVFDKRKLPSNKDDMAVFILVDESGSMGSRKSEAARQTCIAFAEVFAKFKIPIYIMGFTTGEQNGALHHHYITWRNTKAERVKLLNIHGRRCNFDSYSIRYATEVLKKKKAAHKLMIILSDGTPSALEYSTYKVNGVTDTQSAIKEAKKIASVLGVAIGDIDLNAICYMYGSDYIHINNVDDLFLQLSKKIAKLVKNW